MSPAVSSEAKTAHVNLMTDTIIANLPPAALRTVLRALLTTSPAYSIAFEHHAAAYLSRTPFTVPTLLFATPGNPIDDNFRATQARIRSTLSTGIVLESLDLLAVVLEAAPGIDVKVEGVELVLASVDGDIVQAITAVQKRLTTPTGTRALNTEESSRLQRLLDALNILREAWKAQKAFVFERSALLVSQVLGMELPVVEAPVYVSTEADSEAEAAIETFKVGDRDVPRLFSGLWQLSSPAWGIAPQIKIVEQLEQYVSRGFTAYDMADHYGDSEIIFGRFRKGYKKPEKLFAATKFCVFGPINITPEVIAGNVTERLTRLHTDKIDLLQFHWQDYSNFGYIPAMRLLAADSRITALGLCNFDTPNMVSLIEAGIPFATNQIQFSLIDSRPTFAMAEVCRKHNIKLLTYGTLCGGFLAAKWLGTAAPDSFEGGLTPSQRKYYEMICIWGGWELFQELLRTLDGISKKHNVGISNVATRWVLDFDYVGAVIVGTRMGVSGHADENIKTYGWTLDSKDREVIEVVQRKSRREEVFKAMGDCGAEYR